MSSLFNSQDPAIRAAQERVTERLFSGPRIVLNIEQRKLANAVRDQHKDMRRAAAELAANAMALLALAYGARVAWRWAR